MILQFLLICYLAPDGRPLANNIRVWLMFAHMVLVQGSRLCASGQTPLPPDSTLYVLSKWFAGSRIDLTLSPVASNITVLTTCPLHDLFHFIIVRNNCSQTSKLEPTRELMTKYHLEPTFTACIRKHFEQQVKRQTELMYRCMYGRMDITWLALTLTRSFEQIIFWCLHVFLYLPTMYVFTFLTVCIYLLVYNAFWKMNSL